VAKQRPRHTGSTTYTPKRTKIYEEQVAWAARSVQSFADDARISLRITLHDDEAVVEIAEIASDEKSKLTGDIDNYAKSIMDGIVQGGLIANDRQIDILEVWRRGH